MKAKATTPKVKTKHAGGRPPISDSIDKNQVKKLILKGFTDKEVSDFFGMTEQSFNNWKIRDAQFFASLKDWKLEADEKVERALYERACGYRTKFKKNFVVSDGKESGSHVEIHEEEVVFAPDSTACIFWLKNRKKEEWRDRVEMDHSGVINLVEKYKDLSIEQLNEKLSGFVRGSAN